MADPRELGESLRRYQNDMPSSVQVVLFVVLAVLSVGLAVLVGQHIPGIGLLTGAAGIVISALIASAIKVANQWQRGVVLRLGGFRGIRGPGLFVIVPVIDRVRMIDMRVLTHHVSRAGSHHSRQRARNDRQRPVLPRGQRRGRRHEDSRLRPGGRATGPKRLARRGRRHDPRRVAGRARTDRRAGRPARGSRTRGNGDCT